MESYTLLSKIYDSWQEENNPVKWADYIEKIIRTHCRMQAGDGRNGSFLLLDLGCGTGSFAIEMSQRGYDVIGLDLSDEMLNAAREKDGADNIMFIRQDITKMELFGTVDIIVCLLDTVNHILPEAGLNRLFRLCKNYLNPGGLFIFDIATPYYFENVLGNQVFYDVRDEYALIWQNSYTPAKAVSRSELTFFIGQEDQRYLRGEEVIREKAHSIDKTKQMLEANHLRVVKQYREFTFQKPDSTTKRIFFVAENTTDAWKESLKKLSLEERGKNRDPRK